MGDHRSRSLSSASNIGGMAITKVRIETRSVSREIASIGIDEMVVESDVCSIDDNSEHHHCLIPTAKAAGSAFMMRDAFNLGRRNIGLGSKVPE